MSRGRRIFDQVWPRALVVVVILGVWAAISASGLVSERLLPPPASVWSAFTANLDTLMSGVGRSLLRVAVGLAIAVVIGTPLGLWMAASRPFQRSFGSLMVALQALPPIVWLPLAALWFGFSVKAVLYIVVIGATPAVAIATAGSVRHVSPTLVRAGRTLGASGSELYRNVVLPAAVPGYVSGLRQAWTIAWWALLAGELLTIGARGLGHLMDSAGTEGDTALVMAAMVIIMIVGLAVDSIFAFSDRRVRRRRGLLAAA